MQGLLQRLKERKLVQWALAYVAFAFALLQGIDIVAQRFVWPDAIERILILVLCIGFFVALVLAWYHGERGAQRVTGAELVILALLLAIGGGLLWRLERAAPSSGNPDAAQRNPGKINPDSVAGTTSSGLGVAPASAIAPVIPIPAKSIAVLPFENLSADKDNAYFASGMQDLILTKLADIGDLKVISRTSTAKYASHPADLKTIAHQLGVATILEGSVQKAGNQVLINVQLIEARSDSHIWAQSYQRSLDNIFGVEGEVAQKVADALSAKLTSTEQRNIAAIPTTNSEAYDAFLRAESLAYKAQDTFEAVDYRAADAAYRQAISLDPHFALAYARFVINQMNGYWFTRYLSAADLAEAKTSADRALLLAPDLPEAHLALGDWYYWGFRRYDEAAEQFRRTLQLAPNNQDALKGLAYIERRRGNFKQTITFLERALSIAPRDRFLLTEYGITYAILRRYPEAAEQLARALAIDPIYAEAKDFQVNIRLFGYGDAQAARAALAPAPTWQITRYNILAGDVFNLVNPRVYPDFFDRHFDAALHDWDSAPTGTQEERLIERAARVAIQVIAGRQATIQPECGKLKPLLDAQLSKYPDSLSALQQASWVDVCLGRNAEAIAAARHATEVLPVSRDAFYGVYQLEGLAEMEAQAGAPEQAIDLIEKLLEMPAGESMSIARLKLDPLWDPLRGDSRFQALLKKYENAQPVTSANVAAP
jgi:serine/threonine-protein kinase